MIILDNKRAKTELMVSKTFKESLKEVRFLEKHPEFKIPGTIIAKEYNRIFTPQSIHLYNWSKHQDEKGKRRMAKKLYALLKGLWLEGYIHRDLHAGNVIVIEGKPYLIDFENITKHGVDHYFNRSYDLTGENGSPPSCEDMKFPKMCWDDEKCNYSIYNTLGVKSKDV